MASLKKLSRVATPLIQRSFHSGAASVVDLRSDVLTKPTPKMQEAMSKANYDDDVFNENKSVHELQDKVADMFGKEAALFVPSGTMGNLISVVSQCSHAKGLEVILGDQSHIVLYEQGGLAVIGGVHPRTVPNKPDGTFDLNQVESSIRPLTDPHQPWTSLVVVENSHNTCGGKVVPMSFLKKLTAKAQQHNITVHMDGARLLNACVALDVTPKEMLKDIHSVSMCLSKGVGAPVGSVISGTREFIDKGLRLRKMLGGGWRQPGPLAAAGLCALEDAVPRLTQDHVHAKRIAKAIMENHHNMVHIDLAGVHTNIVMVTMQKPGLTAEQFCERLATVTEDEHKELGEKIIVKAMPFYKHVARLVLYSDITEPQVQSAIAKLQYVVTEYAGAENPASASITSNLTTKMRELGSNYLASHSQYAEWESLQYDLAYRKPVIEENRL